jgi:tricorn protease
MPLDRGGFLSYSPDGKQIAFNRIFTNFRTWKRYQGGLGQDIDIYDFDSRKLTQLAIRPAEGGPEMILTHFPNGYFYGPRWSPDGGRLAFSDNEHRLWVVATSGGDPQQVAQDLYQEVQYYTWAPDGRWLAYVLTGANQQSNIWLYSLDSRKATRVSDPRSNDFNPGFDPAGRYLYFISTRHENPTLSRTEFNIATLKSGRAQEASGRPAAAALALARLSAAE